jgi:hypothetical protein
MEVRRTVPVKLDVDSDDTTLLCETVDEFLWAANHVVDHAWQGEDKTTSKAQLQTETYDEGRDRTRLHANLVQNARNKAADATMLPVPPPRTTSSNSSIGTSPSTVRTRLWVWPMIFHPPLLRRERGQGVVAARRGPIAVAHTAISNDRSRSARARTLSRFRPSFRASGDDGSLGTPSPPATRSPSSATPSSGWRYATWPAVCPGVW